MKPSPPVHTRRPDWPPDLDDILLKRLAKDPEARFPVVGTLDQALNACRSAGDWTEPEAAAWWNRFANRAATSSRVLVRDVSRKGGAPWAP